MRNPFLNTAVGDWKVLVQIPMPPFRQKFSLARSWFLLQKNENAVSLTGFYENEEGLQMQNSLGRVWHIVGAQKIISLSPVPELILLALLGSFHFIPEGSPGFMRQSLLFREQNIQNCSTSVI